MPIELETIDDSFFKAHSVLRYILPYDRKFEDNYIHGGLSFYPGSPEYIVSVSIFSDADKLTEKEILISFGDLHNSDEARKIVKENGEKIFQVCKKASKEEYSNFVLDLKTMRVVERDDFTVSLPIHGMSTLFMFNYIPENMFCLVNSTRRGPQAHEEFMAWFLGYIYSGWSCLTPMNLSTDFSKQFMQAISQFGYYKYIGKEAKVIVNTAPHMLNCPLNDMNIINLEVPGKVNRLVVLRDKSFEELAKNRKKEEKRKGFGK